MKNFGAFLHFKAYPKAIQYQQVQILYDFISLKGCKG
jgi:hypothetical protein